ncbi:hypothetical protein [Tsukamurella spumae]|uniref:Transcription elongation factor GreA/GreB C-terminal domain-containing protein n=1 Tax=Tsukamurella spumae TaxID=44753 RepID=A0A846X188_9ACTN|nr:hypothetical protein [Tsukamurella spumae]NKY19034.1 hypothetical protein [Tsukamurella spumae]
MNHLVERLREEHAGMFVPYVAPTYGGTNARLLALLQDPGPRTDAANRDGSGMLCIENADPTATRYKSLLATSGIDVSDIQAWNAFAWRPTTQDRGGRRVLAPSEVDLRDSTDALARLVRLLPRLRVALLHGRHARDAWLRLGTAHPDLVVGIEAIASWHPLVDHPAYRTKNDAAKYTRELTNSFASAADHLRRPDQAYPTTPEEEVRATESQHQADRPTWRSTLNELRARFVALRAQESPEHPEAATHEASRPSTPEEAEPTAPAAQTEDQAEFDRELDQYALTEANLLAQRLSLRADLNECRDSKDRREDYQRLAESERSVTLRLADLERARRTYLAKRDEVVAWARLRGVSTDSRAFRGSIVTIRYADGGTETCVLTERDTDTIYDTVSPSSTLGERLKLAQVDDTIELPNGEAITVTDIRPGFRVSPPVR